MVKKLILTVIALLYIITANAQSMPVRWEIFTKKTGKGELTLYLKATISKGFRLNSLSPAEDGPISTTIVFDSSADYELIGGTQQPEPITPLERNLQHEAELF